jgi:hypothetical protein
MTDLFSYRHILHTYTLLKSRKSADRGKSLPVGIDGMRTEIFERNLEHSIREIERKLNTITPSGCIAYTFGPLLRIDRKKASGGIRSLHVPRLRDQIVLRIIHDEIIHAATPKGLSLNLKAPYRLVNDFDTIVKTYNDPWIVKTDITGFYDTVPRDKAIQLCEDIGIDKDILQLLRQWSDTIEIRGGLLASSANGFNTAGLPQGLSISSSLAELYAKQIDQEYAHCKGYFRYVDDILIICTDKENAKETLKSLKEKIEACGLRLAPAKTSVQQMHLGLEWLGMIHYPDRKMIDPEKLEQWIKPFMAIKKNCMLQLAGCSTKQEMETVLKDMLKKTEKHIQGKQGSRIRWYALCEDSGQWKIMDKYIHGMIRSCLRKANFHEEIRSWELPSVHAKICSLKKIKESQ